MLLELRDYQVRAHDMLCEWMEKNDGNPCVVMPTGSGKSHTIAYFIKWGLQNWPETRILMLTGDKRLIAQNAEKMRSHWPNAPMGIYCASLKKRQLGDPITFGSIQSLINKLDDIGYIDIIIVDECDMINHKDEGQYRKLINHLKNINQHLRVVGYTATPYRMGHGLITDKPALFDAILEPTSIEELIFKGYLTPLRSKSPQKHIDVSGVAKRGGEYIEKDLQEATDTDDNNIAVVDEVIKWATDTYTKWLGFAAGIDHAEHLNALILERGVKSAVVSSRQSDNENNQILKDYHEGKITCVLNANMLTVGFDEPNIDLIFDVAATMSARLYVQKAGRGTRLKDHIDHCLFLDFVGNVETHGPITAVKPPLKKGEKGAGEAPQKVCEHCHEIVASATKICPACGTPFPEPKKEDLYLRNDDIMGIEPDIMQVESWNWEKFTSRKTGKEMLKCSFYGDAISDPIISCYHVVWHEGFAGSKARREVSQIANRCGVEFIWDDVTDLEALANELNQGQIPATIEYKKDGNFYSILRREWG